MCESPNGLTPATTLSQGIPAVQAPAEGNGILDIPSDYAWQGYPKNLDRGYIQSWNVTVQRELPWHFTGQVGYVATRTTRQLGPARHQRRPGYRRRRGRPAPSPAIRQNRIDRVAAAGRQRQVRLDAGATAAAVRRGPQPCGELHLGQGDQPEREQLLALGDHGTQALAYLDRNLRADEHAIDGTTSGSRTSGRFPSGQGRRWLNDGSVASAILGGWQMNNMISIMSGTPFTVFADDTSLNLPGSVQTADQVKDAQKLGGIGRATPYYDPTAFADVTEARFGNTGYNILRGPGLFNWDFGLTREFALTAASGCSSAWSRSTSRTRRIWRLRTTTSATAKTS